MRNAILITCLIIAAPSAWAQDAATSSAPVPTMETAPVAPVAPSMAPEAPAPMKAAPAPQKPSEGVSAPKPKAEWKTAGFWIFKIVIPVVFFILALLVSINVIKREWLAWVRKKGIITVADKVVTGFESYAKGTPANWDDILAQAMRAVIVRFGELLPEEEETVKKLVEERKEQAEKKAE